MDMESLVTRALIDLASDRIVKRLAARTRSALVLISGTDLGLAPAMRSLVTLRATGWSFEMLRSPEARHLVTPRSLDGFGCSSLIDRLDDAADETDVALRLSRNSLVLVPAMSVTLAAKLAQGIADDPLSALLQGAIERGTRIVAARDGCCPASRERIERGLGANSAYRALMTRHLEAIESYGVELCWATRMQERVLRAAPMQSPALLPQITPVGQVFGWGAAKHWQGAELRLGKDVLITPLAAEELSARHIRVIRN